MEPSPNQFSRLLEREQKCIGSLQLLLFSLSGAICITQNPYKFLYSAYTLLHYYGNVCVGGGKALRCSVSHALCFIKIGKIGKVLRRKRVGTKWIAVVAVEWVKV